MAQFWIKDPDSEYPEFALVFRPPEIETADFTPLEYLVMEVEADSFSNRIFTETNHPFINILDEKDKAGIWNLIKPEMNTIDTYIKTCSFTGRRIFHIRLYMRSNSISLRLLRKTILK